MAQNASRLAAPGSPRLLTQVGLTLVPWYAYNESDDIYVELLREQPQCRKPLLIISQVSGGLVVAACIILWATLIDLFSTHRDLASYSAFTSGVLTFAPTLFFLLIAPSRAENILCRCAPQAKRKHTFPVVLKVGLLFLYSMVFMLMYGFLLVLASVAADDGGNTLFNVLRGTLVGVAGGIGCSLLFFWGFYLFFQCRQRMRIQQMLVRYYRPTGKDRPCGKDA